MSRRPLGIWAVAIALVLAALVAAGIGLLMTFVSAIAPPADPSFALVGIAVSTACAAAAIGTWTGRLRRRTVLALAATAPAALVAGTFEGSDFDVPAVLGVLGWVGLVLVLHRSAPAGWLARRGQVEAPGSIPRDG